MACSHTHQSWLLMDYPGTPVHVESGGCPLWCQLHENLTEHREREREKASERQGREERERKKDTHPPLPLPLHLLVCIFNELCEKAGVWDGKPRHWMQPLAEPRKTSNMR